VAGVPIADTTHPLFVWEHNFYPAYYLPASDVRTDLLVPSGTVSNAPNLGEAVHYTVKVDGEERVDAAWQYVESPIEALRDHIRFEWRAMDAWFEEDEEVFVHPRSPYTRVDVLPSSRNVRVEIDGVVVAETTRAHVLHETGLPPRWYIPKDDVRMELLTPTDSATQCPYKGTAEYWTVRVGDRELADSAWSYPEPLPESRRIAGLVCFYNEKVDLTIDGELQARPRTKFA
jgi:uncharacterized protein (DUF427 family)